MYGKRNNSSMVNQLLKASSLIGQYETWTAVWRTDGLRITDWMKHGLSIKCGLSLCH